MSSNMKTNKQTTINHLCPFCNGKKHKWSQAYYANSSKLEMIEQAYISFCEMKDDYILITKTSN